MAERRPLVLLSDGSLSELPIGDTLPGVIVATPTYAYAEVSTTYTVLTTDYTVNCTSGTFTVTLPTAVGIEGQIFVIMNSGDGLITLEGNGSETIQGDLTQVIYQDESFTVQSTGANYIVI